MPDDIKEAIAALLGLREAAGGLRFAIPEDSASKLTTGIALLLSVLDLGSAIAALVENDPEGGWLASHTLQRPQMEHFLRGAFFLGPASTSEADRFLQEGKMPTRKDGNGKKRPIWLAKLAEEASFWWEWEAALREACSGTNDDLSDLVHGGRRVVAIYYFDDSIGAAKVSSKELVGMFCNPLVYSAQALILLRRIANVGHERDAIIKLALDTAHHAVVKAGLSLDNIGAKP